MVQVKDYVDYLETYTSLIPAIKKVVWTIKETMLSNKMKNLTMKDYPLLVVVIPSSDASSPDVDNTNDINSSLIYCLKKYDATNFTDAKMLDDYQETQQLLEQVKQQMIDDSHAECNLFGNLQQSNFHIDPEFDFMGCNGWSMSFEFLTPDA